MLQFWKMKIELCTVPYFSKKICWEHTVMLFLTGLAMWLWLLWYSECSSGWPYIHSKHFSFLGVGIVCTTVQALLGLLYVEKYKILSRPLTFNEYLKMVISLINVIYQPWSSISATDTIKCKKRKTKSKTESTDLAVDRVGLAFGPEAHFTWT